MRLSKLGTLIITLIIAATAGSARGSEAESLVLKNKHVQRELRRVDGSWRTIRFARADGSDAIEVQSDEFHILPLDSEQGWTVANYVATGPPVRSEADGVMTVRVSYRQRQPLPEPAPKQVTVAYALGTGPTHHKTVSLAMKEGQIIDRLQVERFSTAQQASRGGFGQPVFIGNWFFGIEYTGFFSWHSNDCIEPDYNYRWFYDVELEGREREFEPRNGLVTLFHYPGYAREQPDESWGIVSKQAVAGICRTPGENAELALLDHVARTRKRPRSHLHFNNWYSSDAKFVTRENFVENTARPIFNRLTQHGAHLDAMVPDHGWQDGKSFQSIYQPQDNPTHESLPKIQQSLEQLGTKLGIWISLDGTNNSLSRGREIGYRSAYADSFDRSRRWMQGKEYFDILQSKYQNDLKQAIRYLLTDVGVDYIKHDFNHNFTSHYITERHARERCLDVTLELLAFERSLNPHVFQNYTNGSWFSPWWLQHVDTLWMMSGDSGNNTGWPQVSLRDNATTYRDSWLFQSFNNPQRCTRPILPVANLMTHGILFSKKKPYTDFRDPLHEWSDYVVMHLARGTMVKELYITPELLNDAHWKVLGKAAAWAQKNQHRLINTVYVGGDPGAGAVYGYISWVDGRAIVTVRNPDRAEQVLEVPFDRSVYFRGEAGQDYRARVIYPFVEVMPWKLVSGQPIEINVPGDSVMVLEIEPGTSVRASHARPDPLPASRAESGDGTFSLHLNIPDEDFGRYDLLVQTWAAVDTAIGIDGKSVTPDQRQQATRWTIARYDLRDHRGRTIAVSGSRNSADGRNDAPASKVPTEAWLVVDRQVDAPAESLEAGLPFAISHGYRRLTQNVLSETPR